MGATSFLLFDTSTAGYIAGVDDTPPSEATPLRVSGVVSVAVQVAFGFKASDLLPEGAWTTLENIYEVKVDRPTTRLQGVLVRYEAGRCRVVLDNTDRSYDPSNIGGPYGNPSSTWGTQLLPMTPVRVIARAPYDPDGLFVDIGGDGGTSDVDYPLFRGYADRWEASYGAHAKTSTTTLTATDGMKVLAKFDGPEQSSQGAGDLAGARITRILDNAGWDPDLRSIEDGVSTLQATTLAQPTLTDLLLASDSDRGDLFIDGRGWVTFYDRQHRNLDTRSLTPQADWGDLPDELKFANPVISNDDTLIVNQVNIANVGGTMQTAEDATSQEWFLVRSEKRDDLILESDGAALSYASLILAQRKDPYLRIDGFDYDPGSLVEQTRTAPSVLGVQVADRWKVRFTPPGSTERIIRDVWVVGMSWWFQHGRWGASFQFQPITFDIDTGARFDLARFDVDRFAY